MHAFAIKQKSVEVSAMWKGQTSAILVLDILRKAWWPSGVMLRWELESDESDVTKSR
jgi:hypothetical protein